MKKKKYDTSVVMLYLIGKEHLLPREFRSKIPYNTIASWRRMEYTSNIGQEFRIFFEDRTDYLVVAGKRAASLLLAFTKDDHLKLMGFPSAMRLLQVLLCSGYLRIVSGIRLGLALPLLKPRASPKVSLSLVWRCCTESIFL